MAKENDTEIWTLENNNVCFRYKKRKYHQDMWRIIIPFILCFTIILTEVIGWRTFVSVLPCMIFLFIMALNWLAHTDEKNENSEKEIIWNVLCDKIKSDIVKYGENINIVRYKYQIDFKGTYGIVTGQWLVVLLSNNKVLEYKVEYHKPEGETPLYYEVFLEPTESTNFKHLKAIQKRKLINYIKKPSEKAQFAMWILAIIIFGLGIFILGFYLVETYKWNLLIFIGAYLVLYITISHFTKNRENKIVKTLKSVIDTPFEVFNLALRCTLPAFSIIAGLKFMALFALGIPLLIMNIIGFFLQTSFTHPTYIFVTVSAATILCGHCSKFMHDLISKLTPLRDWGDHEYQKLSIDLALYVLSKKNIIFLIYFAYLAFMAITGFKQIQYSTYLISSEIDLAVTKAFLLFIAYTNMVSKSLEVDVNRKELLSKIIRLLLSHDKHSDE